MSNILNNIFDILPNKLYYVFLHQNYYHDYLDNILDRAISINLNSLYSIKYNYKCYLRMLYTKSYPISLNNRVFLIDDKFDCFWIENNKFIVKDVKFTKILKSHKIKNRYCSTCQMHIDKILHKEYSEQDVIVRNILL